MPGNIPMLHLPIAPNPLLGMHHKHGVYKGEHQHHGGPHAHGKYGHYDHGDHRHAGGQAPSSMRSQQSPLPLAHRENGAAGAHSAHRPHAGVHHPQYVPVGQHPGQSEPTQTDKPRKMRAGSRHPAGVAVGLAIKPHADHTEGVQPAQAGEPRAFDEDDCFAREFDEDDHFAPEFDKELLARALADGLVTRKVTFGQVIGDLAHFLKRDDEGLLARVYNL